MQPKLVTHGDLSKATAFLQRFRLKDHPRADDMQTELANMLANQREMCFAAGQNSANVEARKASNASYDLGYEAGHRAAHKKHEPPPPIVLTPSRPPPAPFMPPVPAPVMADEAPTRTRTKKLSAPPAEGAHDATILEALRGSRPRSLALVCAYTLLDELAAASALNALKRRKLVLYREGLWSLATPAPPLPNPSSHPPKTKEKR